MCSFLVLQTGYCSFYGAKKTPNKKRHPLYRHTASVVNNLAGSKTVHHVSHCGNSMYHLYAANQVSNSMCIRETTAYEDVKVEEAIRVIDCQREKTIRRCMLYKIICFLYTILSNMSSETRNNFFRAFFYNGCKVPVGTSRFFFFKFLLALGLRKVIKKLN